MRLAGAASTLKGSSDAEGRLKEMHEAAATELAGQTTAVKRLEAERDALSRKLVRLSSKESAAGGGGSAENEQLEFYRAKVKCTLCRTNDKDTIINKCGHTFCRECIQKRLDLRNRKCPSCALQFDFQAVKDMYLTA